MQKTVVKNFLDHKAYKNDGIEDKVILNNHHDEIVTKDNFDYVQIVLKGKKEEPNNKTERKDLNPLNGLTYCGCCKLPLVKITTHPKTNSERAVLTCRNIKRNGVGYRSCSYHEEVTDYALALAEQIKNYTALIMQNPNWEFAGIYPDDGKSGSNVFGRKEFIKMLENARLGLIDIILVKSISRFARNLIDMLEIIREFRDKGIEIYFEEQEVSSLDVKADQMITIYAKFAEEELETISNNVKWRYEKNKRDGKYVLPPNLYGYRIVNGKITIVPKEAKWIKTIYGFCLDGHGSSYIVKYLSDNHVPSPTGKREWGHNTICSILRNEKYAGDCLMQKTIKDSVGANYSSKNRGEEDMVMVRNGHTPIIDRKTWDEVQAILDERCKRFRINKEPHKTFCDFTGFLACGTCGSNYSSKVNHYYGVNGTKRTRFLICNRNRHFKQCESENIPEEKLKEGIILLTKKIKDNMPYFKEMLIKGFGMVNINKKEKRIAAIEDEIGELKEELTKHAGKFDEYSTSMASEIMNQISSLTIEKMNLENEVLIAGSVEERTKSVVMEFNKVPNKIDSFDDFDYRKLYSRGIVKGKEDIILIIGNNDVSKLPRNIKSELQVCVPYKVRLTTYRLKLSINVNI